jgi:hypothetical protein
MLPIDVHVYVYPGCVGTEYAAAGSTKQIVSNEAIGPVTTTGGSIKITVLDATQPLASVTTTAYVP